MEMFHVEGNDNVIICVCHKILLGSSNQGGYDVRGVLYSQLWREVRTKLWSENQNGRNDAIEVDVALKITLKLMLNILYIYIFFFCGAATQRGSWPPHS